MINAKFVEFDDGLLNRPSKNHYDSTDHPDFDYNTACIRKILNKLI
jgi:hypothetical protein